MPKNPVRRAAGSKCIVCGRKAEVLRVCTDCSRTHDSTTGDRLARHPGSRRSQT